MVGTDRLSQVKSWMGGGAKDWLGMGPISGGAINLSWVSCAVGKGGIRLNAGTTFGVLRVCTGILSMASKSGVYTFFRDSVENSSARS